MYTFCGEGVNLKERGNMKELVVREQGQVRAVENTVRNRWVVQNAGKFLTV